jgi:hypothetical protein
MAADGSSVQIQQVERNKDALPAAEEKVPEVWSAILINKSDLAIDNGVFDFEVFGHPGGKVRESVECVPVS